MLNERLLCAHLSAFAHKAFPSQIDANPDLCVIMLFGVTTLARYFAYVNDCFWFVTTNAERLVKKSNCVGRDKINRNECG